MQGATARAGAAGPGVKVMEAQRQGWVGCSSSGWAGTGGGEANDGVGFGVWRGQGRGGRHSRQVSVSWGRRGVCAGESLNFEYSFHVFLLFLQR